MGLLHHEFFKLYSFIFFQFRFTAKWEAEAGIMIRQTLPQIAAACILVSDASFPHYIQCI